MARLIQRNFYNTKNDIKEPHMRKLIAGITLTLCGLAHSADRPDLSVPWGAAKLAVTFTDSDTWNGKRIPVTLQCAKRGGVGLKVSGAPAGTQKLVVFFSDPRAFNNHGLFSYEGTATEGVYTVPAIKERSTKLPAGMELFQGGSTWGAGYNAPCPLQSMQHSFTVTVYALNETGAVIAKGETDMGYAE
jgi:phosphatidylethanolamine-binding protein (PEBP) family uncharacterized protein